jgi:hypothetical protein
VIIILLAVHTVLSLLGYRFLVSRTETELPVNSTPVEITTPEQRARGESSWQLETRGTLVQIEQPRFLPRYVISGYVALMIALGVTIAVRIRQP